MASGFFSLLLVAGVGLALLLIAGGIVLLVVGLKRHDDSSSRPFLAFGVVLLILGTVVLVPALIMASRALISWG